MECSSVDQEIVFHLSRDEEQRARRLASPGPYGRMMWAAIVLAVLWGAQIVVALVLSARPISFYMAIVFCVTWIGLAIAYGTRRLQPLAREGSIRVSLDGIAGTLNGEPMTLPWKLVAGARDSADFIIINPRRYARPIAIPKTSVDSAAALWAYLEDRLVSRRLLVRSIPARTFIENTAA